MSDYIHNLVARQLAATSQVKPRLLSMFEPPGKTASALLNNQPGHAALNPEEAETGSGDPETTPSRAALPGAQAHPSSIEPASAVWRGPQVAHLAWHSIAQDKSEREAEALRDARAQKPAGATTPSHATDKSATSPLSSATGEPDSQARPVSVKPSLTPSPLTAREVGADERAIASQMTETKNGAGVDSTPPGAESKKSREVVRPRVITPVENRKAPDGATSNIEPEGSAAAPVISVTIGRVEVRAELQDASRQRSPQQRSPLMSLEEYLRRRTKGGGT